MINNDDYNMNYILNLYMVENNKKLLFEIKIFLSIK